MRPGLALFLSRLVGAVVKDVILNKAGWRQSEISPIGLAAVGDFTDRIGQLGRCHTESERLFPSSLLGVILMFGGLELAAGARANGAERADRYVMVFTAGVAMWNMGAGYLTGLALWHALQRKWLRV